MRSLALRERGFWSCSSGEGVSVCSSVVLIGIEGTPKLSVIRSQICGHVAEVIFDWSILQRVVSDDYKPPLRSQ